MICLLLASCNGHCNPYDGCEPDPPGEGDPCVWVNFFSDAGEQVSTVCADGLVCNRLTEVCVPPPDVGEPCSSDPEHGSYDVSCREGLVCSVTSGLCAEEGGVGFHCGAVGVTTGCNEGLICHEGTCAEPLASGDECAAGDACPPGTVCHPAGVASDPRRGRCMAPQAAGGPCAWSPWGPAGLGGDGYWVGCADGLYCRPDADPDPPTATADADFVSCRDELAESGETTCLGLPGTCVAADALERGEPCLSDDACDVPPCYRPATPLGLETLDGFDCEGDPECALFPWPGFCAGLGEYTLPGNGCTRGDKPCPRGMACNFDSDTCVNAYQGDVGARCGGASPDYSDPALCIAGLDCVADTDGNYYCE